MNDPSGVPSGNDMEVDFDNILLDAVAIPEPSTVFLLGLAGLLFLQK